MVCIDMPRYKDFISDIGVVIQRCSNRQLNKQSILFINSPAGSAKNAIDRDPANQFTECS